MSRRGCRLSSVEVLLLTLIFMLFVVCVGLIVISWLALDKNAKEVEGGETGSEFAGTLVISNGTIFTEELLNKSSVQFKALAYDTEQQINKAYRRSSLQEQFKNCKVNEFSEGSVVVHFELLFSGVVHLNTAQEQLVECLEQGEAGSDEGLVIDTSSVQVTDKETITQRPSTTKPATTVKCPEGQKACADGTTCVPQTQFCDGIQNCPDGSDETQNVCATVCDGQFLLLGLTGSFHSKNFPLDYDSNTACRWIIRVNEGLAIKIAFHSFYTEEDIDVLDLYEGTGPTKKLTYSLSGTSPGNIWLLSHEATVEFYADFINNFQGFNASYRAEKISQLSNEDKINCTFEEDFCLWRQEQEDDGDWLRVRGSTLPPDTGPSFDHTMGNQSGYYIVTPRSPGSWDKTFRIYSVPLAPVNESICLRFWYHMFGEEVWRLAVLVEEGSASTLLFWKEGNYGDNWNYGQVTLNYTTDAVVIFEAQKKAGFLNDIALDDISIVPGSCSDGLPDPTLVPPPITLPPIPTDCGGPFDLYESNSTFSSPNYPNGYGNDASCMWTLHAMEGQTIQLHFQDVALEASTDILEVRDGVEPYSELLGVLTGDRSFPDLFSKTSQMNVMLFTDSSRNDKGFLANFSTGLHLGQPDPCPTGQFQCSTGVCVSIASVCDGEENCSDGSDEADCVHIIKHNLTGAERLRLQVQNNLYTVCAQNWTSQLSDFFCHYLGYRSGNASFSNAMDGDAPFTTVALNANGMLDLKPSDKCLSEKITSLHCNNHPCGFRKVPLKNETNKDKEMGQIAGKVVGGQDAQEGAWPWIVSLRWQGRHVCGASLIDREWLVTAAHCVFGMNVYLSNWAAVLGLHTQFGTDDSERQVHSVDQIIMNKRYNRRTKESDIALIHLQTPANFTNYIQPICLPDSGEQFGVGRKCFIAGWGKLAEDGSVANVLQQAVLPLLNNTQCQKWLPEYNITERMVCAGYAEGGVDSCQGDSGGPLMCEEDDHWVLVGVTSFGKGCGQPQRPGVYTRVSQFVDWVVETRRLYSDWKGYNYSV
ncbi:enteropeptidase-like [Myxocyprinus asiaticus]|uniref:enteropeptidase-like n=1 Tax=Myxocyprinus asiaticus TaxID=70543 RepID=UPI0022215B14|nr:enteropeptidase-like [Myxocyprinus asiaticus]